MKYTKLLLAPSLLFLFLAFNRCTPNKDFISSTNEILTRSNWGIEYFFDSQDMTSNYGGYQLLFSSTGSVAAKKQTETALGTWSITTDANNAEILTLHFNTSDININKFNQQWGLTGKSTSTLQFEELPHSGNNSQLRIRQQ